MGSGSAGASADYERLLERSPQLNIFARQGRGFASRATGQIRNASTGKPFAEPGLWALLPGTAATGGTGALWFTAGINDEQDGLLGVLRP
jgi:hypothetical protein